ncbi:unnamed protein product, partial [Amoebophrya sp. A120]
IKSRPFVRTRRIFTVSKLQVRNTKTSIVQSISEMNNSIQNMLPAGARVAVAPTSDDHKRSPKRTKLYRTKQPGKVSSPAINCLPSTSLSRANEWIDLQVPPEELRLEHTLPIGQTFGWKEITPPVVRTSSSGGAAAAAAPGNKQKMAKVGGAAAAAKQKAKVEEVEAKQKAKAMKQADTTIRVEENEAAKPAEHDAGRVKVPVLPNQTSRQYLGVIAGFGVVLESLPTTTRFKVLAGGGNPAPCSSGEDLLRGAGTTRVKTSAVQVELKTETLLEPPQHGGGAVGPAPQGRPVFGLRGVAGDAKINLNGAKNSLLANQNAGASSGIVSSASGDEGVSPSGLVAIHGGNKPVKPKNLPSSSSSSCALLFYPEPPPPPPSAFADVAQQHNQQPPQEKIRTSKEHTAAPTTFLHGKRTNQNHALTAVRHYFRLDHSLPLKSLYDQWSAADPWFRQVARKLVGVRLLRQDVFETMISFLVSQNNNVVRIAQILGRIRREYGHKIVDPATAVDDFYSFPTVAEFVKHNPSEQEFRDLGLGYRAKYLRQILEHLARIYELEEFLKTNKTTAPAVTEPTSKTTRTSAAKAAVAAAKGGKTGTKSAAGAMKVVTGQTSSRKAMAVLLKSKAAKAIKSAMKGNKAKPLKAIPTRKGESTVKKANKGNKGQKIAMKIFKASTTPVAAKDKRKTPEELQPKIPDVPTLRLEAFSDLSTDKVVEELMRYPGIGHKVADCIALFSCDCLDLVPVDTHVWQIAKQRYLPKVKPMKVVGTASKATARTSKATGAGNKKVLASKNGKKSQMTEDP